MRSAITRTKQNLSSPLGHAHIPGYMCTERGCIQSRILLSLPPTTSRIYTDKGCIQYCNLLSLPSLPPSNQQFDVSRKGYIQSRILLSPYLFSLQPLVVCIQTKAVFSIAPYSRSHPFPPPISSLMCLERGCIQSRMLLFLPIPIPITSNRQSYVYFRLLASSDMVYQKFYSIRIPTFNHASTPPSRPPNFP